MGKTTEKFRKYKIEWELEKWAEGWLEKADSHCFNEAYCKVCRKPLRAHATDSRRHAERKEHISIMARFNAKRKITSDYTVILGDTEKTADMKIAAYIACHSAIRSVDDLCGIVRDLGKGSSLENLKMHRTKCGNVIKNVIAPCMLKELVQDVCDMPYSLIVDESTDVSTFKYLCLCIKYFSKNQNRIVTDYLGIITVESATANDLYDSVKKFLDETGLNKAKTIGIGTDVDFLIREIYNWFNVPPKRRASYKKMWETLNAFGPVGEDGETRRFHLFVQLSDTRWLSRDFAVKIVLENWVELKVHFNLVVQTEKCYTARIINDMLNDNTNYLYLRILKSILGEVQCVNLLFQRDDVDLCLAYDDLSRLIMLFAKKILKKSFFDAGINAVLRAFDNDLAYRNFKEVDFGTDYRRASGMYPVTQQQRDEEEERAFKYLRRLCMELAQRMPTCLKQFQGLKSLAPSVCLSQIQPAFQDLPFLKEFAEDDKLGIIEVQWCKLPLVDWKSVFEGEIPNKSGGFWPEVYTFQDAGGRFVFRDLALYVLRTLTLPSSNAVVERVFSVMNAVKTKARNKMSFLLLDAILRLRIRFNIRKICCKDFQPTREMMKKFTADVVYPKKKSEEETQADNHVLEVVDDIDLPCIHLPDPDV